MIQRLRLAARPTTELAPIRDEILGVERLEELAQSLAARDRVLPGRRQRGVPLRSRLDDNLKAFQAAYRALTEAIERDQAISPAAEWIVDNAYLVDEQGRVIRDGMPLGYYRQLPKLADGPLAGYPRAYGLVHAFVAHTDSRFDPDLLERFTRAYQRITPLMIGELWAMPVLLRAVLVENLRRIAEQIVGARRARAEAQALADRLLEASGDAHEESLAALEDGGSRRLTSAFVVALVQRLRESDPAATPALGWLESRLAEGGATSDEVVRREQLDQLAAHATTVNVITSMRQVSAYDWTDFVEGVSLVERILRRDPTRTYPQMDFATRDSYRHAVEELARGAGMAEESVAERVLDRATAAAATGEDTLERYLGTHLLRGGRRAFERDLGYRPGPGEWIGRAYLAAATPGYLGTIAVVAALLVALLLVWAAGLGVGPAVLVALGILAIVPATDLAIAVVHRDVNELVDPRRLPKLDFSSGVPDTYATLVAVPTMLTSEAVATAQAEQLERHYLSGAGGHIAFALLTDWADADTPTATDDERLLAAAATEIAALNERYGPRPDGGPRFLLLHRKRRWNPAEGVWMGWERKRGKIHELNRLLRGGRDTSFIVRGDGLTDLPERVRFVLTLDADTRLAPGATHRLVGALAHPLNRPRYDAEAGRVVAGYGVLQPRITPMLPPPGEGSLYHRVFSGPTGIDPYASAVSDVYQDLFGEGSYVGKGIYDIDAFEAALHDRVPENAILSHDLFEGSFARTGLVTDVELFDDFPTHYQTSARRAHRWARGDWQLLPWIVGRPPTVDGVRRPASLPVIGRWKMIDNLRRTLSAPSTLLLLVAGWALLPASPLLWTGFVVLTIALPATVPVVTGLLPRHRGIAKRSHVRGILADAVGGLTRVGLAVVFMANRTAIMVDAIARTLWRMAVSRRRLLEWVTAAQARHGVAETLGEAYASMWPPVALAGAAGALLAVVRPSALPMAAPVLLAWAASPAVALLLSRPVEEEPRTTLDPEAARHFRLVARRTWRFFEEFVTEADGWLPPDNLQEDPEPLLAHRTSPTNIGLYLLSATAARDYGWIGGAGMIDRLDRTLEVVEGLDRFRGHLYNWYDTTSRAPLEPRYVSTVDSGNLAGHLLTLAETCRRATEEASLGPAALDGIADALGLATEAARAVADEYREGTVSRHDLQGALESLARGIVDPPATARGWAARLGGLAEAASTLVDVAEVLDAESDTEAASELAFWSRAIAVAIAEHGRDLDVVAPWARKIDEAPPAEIAGAPELEARWGALAAALDGLPSPRGLARQLDEAEVELAALRSGLARIDGAEAALERVKEIGAAMETGRAGARELVERLERVAVRAERLVDGMEFGFLYDPNRHLFAVGYRAAEGKMDASTYDLLASEARLASLVAIAKGDVPVEHWFRLGRPITPVGRGSALLSWSGSMFEYLMPYLVMESPPGTLLYRSQRLVVGRQVRYGEERGVPWGVSESAYNARDLGLRYQYSHFGIPGLGLTRGLGDDLVVAPYATALGAMVDPRAADRNFRRLAATGALGRRGFYEALDYTPARVPKGQDYALVRAYMAHHQGMSIVALANVLTGGTIRDRFHAVPMIGATELLLQERVPRDVAVARPRAEEVKAVRHVREIVPPVLRRFTTPHTPAPRTHLLSNGRYSVMITNAGGGYSRWNDLAVTRWREDPTRDAWGAFVYVRDVSSGVTWSAGYQPTTAEPDHYEAVFSEDRAEIHRRDEAIWTTLEVVVSPEDDAELRRITVKNLGARTREIELTSYAEIVLAPGAADLAHPAYQKLFVQTEFQSPYEAILATRRPRSADDPRVWAAHVVTVEGGETVGGPQYETDRSRFLDRGRGVRQPSVVADGRPLSNTTGAVLDPIFALRRTIRLRAGETARVTFSTVVAGSRDAVLALVDKYHAPATFEREASLAWTQAQVQLQHLGIEPDEAHLFQRLASRLLYLDPSLRPPESVRVANRLGQPELWRLGISGDRPILLVRIDHMRDREIVRQLIRAHEYWGWKGLAVDLVVVNEHAVSYAEDLQDWLDRQVRVSQSRARHEDHAGHGEIHILRADQLTDEDRTLLRAAARAVLLSHHGSAAEQLEAAMRDRAAVEPPPAARRPTAMAEAPPPRPRLAFFNGLGGFADGGREYVTILGAGQWTPAPWINVIANRAFGTQVSESGSGFTWAVNSRENRLTPWSNDPVSDPAGEAIYLKDQDTGDVWTPTPLPIREPSPYVVRHGQGYSRFEVTCREIATELTVFVPLDDPIKVSRLVLRNLADRERRVSVTAYAEWVLGVFRAREAPHIRTAFDEETGALFAWNDWNPEFAGRVAFADLAGQQDEWTTDRTEFVGRNGTLRNPAAVASDAPLGQVEGGGGDPCAALRRFVRIPPGGEVEVVVLLGQAGDVEAARDLVTRYRTADLGAALDRVVGWWDDALGALQVRTPDYSMAIMLNRWLLYQALSCRVWARSAFYQSGGAYGFRDQLQDVMALVVARREIAREHLLRAAGRQFPEGDVQHWWHPPSGRGVRTRISDDRLWLPFAALHYLAVTGDEGVLDEAAPFVEGQDLEADEHEVYFEPEETDEAVSLYEHCARAIDVSLRTGRHGLPLIGTGDWNDGMNRVGHEGRGESVWLAWFLHMALTGFARIAEARGDDDRAGRWDGTAKSLAAAIEENGWDGDWYRRAYFDDGTPLGSTANAECRIDSIAQSWAVLSGAGRADRAVQAMKAVEQYLVRRGDGLVLLFTPPFDRTPLDPGYIKGYLPGVRENGGQYTHAAIWSVLALAELGDGDGAAELFSILNPINHASTRAGIHRYKVEPYVAVADVYAEPPHVGRGGWTWYTGSAGWMYRAGIEWILGFRLRGRHLVLDPCIPRDWPGYELSFRYHSARYEIAVENPAGVMRGIKRLEVDDEAVPDCGRVAGDDGPEPARGARIELVDDGEVHRVRVVLG